MSTDALFQLGIVPVSLNTTQTEDSSLAHTTGHRRARLARALTAVPASPASVAFGRHVARHACAMPASSYPPTRR